MMLTKTVSLAQEVATNLNLNVTALLKRNGWNQLGPGWSYKHSKGHMIRRRRTANQRLSHRQCRTAAGL